MAEVYSPCKCYVKKCKSQDENACLNPHCEECNRACCNPDCKTCKEKCVGVTDPGGCQCVVCDCGCGKLCGTKNSKPCSESQCERCKERCLNRRAGDICICRNCSCGCGYGLCNCCEVCPRSSCKRNCDGFVVNENGEKKCDKNGKCKGHHPDGPNGQKKFSYGDYFDEFGNCIRKCKDCGTTCFQGLYYQVGYAVVPLLIVLVSLFIFWAMFPEKFHAMMAKIRATFANSTESSRATTKSLVGKRIPEEMNNEKYPAFRPRAYGGLSSA